MNNTLTCLPNDQLSAQGAAILRVAAELEDFLQGEDVPESLHNDLREMKLVGEWLVRSTKIDLKAATTNGIPTSGYSAHGFTVTQ